MISILYVEDNPDDAEMAIRLFSNSDMDMTCVANVNAAFVAMEKDNYDLVVCDMMMPGQDGRIFAKKFTDSDIQTPFILTSGVSSLRGFNGYHGLKNYLGFILKPITLDKIDRFLEGRIKR